MNQQKIGKFIATCRKEKKLTQEQLAEKLGITKNAVSKWERGMSLPDVSLFKSLCEELDISIEELINGEKDNSDEAKEKAIITTLNEKNRVKRNSKKVITTLCIVFAIILLGLLYYNEKLKVNLVTDSDYLYDEALNYIRNQEIKENKDKDKKDFNIFNSYYGFGIEKDGDYKYAYMWLCGSSYYIEKGDSLVMSSSESIPCKVTFKDDKVIKVEYPKDGGLYEPSIKKLFPLVIAIQVLNFDKEENINKMFKDITDRSMIYYDYLSLDLDKLTIDDLSYNDVIFNVEVTNHDCITVLLSVLKNNKYILYTAYKACPQGELCNLMLEYTKTVQGTYDFDVMDIIKHSIDANNMTFTNDTIPKYGIYSGKGHHFVSNDDNKPLREFLNSINVDLEKCAAPDYGN